MVTGVLKFLLLAFALNESLCLDCPAHMGSCDASLSIPCAAPAVAATGLVDCATTQLDAAINTDPLCKFFNFNQLETNNCAFFSDCLQAEPETCKQCLYGEKSCSPTCNGNVTWAQYGSDTLDLANSYDDCAKQCHDDPTCTHFTFFSGSTSHLGMKKPTCQRFVDVTVQKGGCIGCSSGQKTCENIRCSEDLCCDGIPFFQQSTTYDGCISLCNDDSRCKWFSFYNELGFCKLFDTSCQTPSQQDTGTCSSGQSGCPNLPVPSCGEDYCCADIPLETSYGSEAQCISTCEAPKCLWYTHITNLNICLHYDGSCEDKANVGEGICTSGEGRCPIGGTTSAPGTTTTVSGATTTTTSSTETWVNAKIDGIVYFANFTDTKEACYNFCVASGTNCIGVSYQIDVKKCQQYQTYVGLIPSSIHLSRLI